MILDTSFLIDLHRGHPGAVRHLRVMADEGHAMAIPTVGLVEYLAGFEDEQAALDALTAACQLVEFTVDDARVASRIVRQGFETGRFPGWNDAFIGAVAKRLGMPVVTRNPRHFEGVETIAY